MKTCPACKGTGLGHPIYHAGAEFTQDGIEDTRCEQCDGVGRIQPHFIGLDLAKGEDRSALAIYSEEMQQLLARNERLERRLADMKIQRDTEAAIVNRIWHIFQSPTYQELRGASLYDLVEEALSMAVSAYRKKDMETIPRQGRPESLEMDEYYRIVISEIINQRATK